MDPAAGSRKMIIAAGHIAPGKSGIVKNRQKTYWA
jgi:hypothetical protein